MMSNKPQLSVIVPCYNSEKHLDRSLGSLINQNFRDIEIICVNDGSTDATKNILDEYAEKDQRIVVAHKTNGGISSARNEGLKHVSSKYVTFLDHDDMALPEIYESTLPKMLADEDIDLVTWRHMPVMIDETSSIIEMPEKQNKVLFEGKNEFNHCLRLHDQTLIWEKIFKIDIVRRYNITFPENLYFEDVAFCHKYAAHVKFGYFLNRTLLRRLMHTGSAFYYFLNNLPQSDQWKRWSDPLAALKNVFDHILSVNLWARDKELMSDLLISALSGLCQTPYCAEALEEGRKLAIEYKLPSEKNKSIQRLLNHGDHRRIKYNWLEHIASVKNEGGYKVINLLGMKARFKRRGKASENDR